MLFPTRTSVVATTLALALLHCGGAKNANAPTNPDTEMAPAERPPTPAEPLDAGTPPMPDAAVPPAAVASKAEAPKPDTLND